MKLAPLAYLASYLLSLLGNSVAGVALPLIVLATTGSALGAGTVAAATAVPAVLAGLFMGTLIDRINRRTSSVLTDLISAASVAALPIIDSLTGLSLGWFILCGIIGSLGDVPGMTAREALLPAVVRHSGITAERIVGIREALGAMAMLLGPAVAGTLITLFEGSTVLWITAGTSLAAALLTLLIPHRIGRIDAHDVGETTTASVLVPGAPGPGEVAASGSGPTVTSAPSERMWAQLVDGWRVLLGHRFLLAVTVLSIASVLVLGGLQGLVMPVYFTLVERPEMLGFVLSSLAAGLLIGSAVYAVVGTRVRRRVWFVTSLLGSTAGMLVVAVLASPWLVFAGAFLLGAFSGLSNGLLGVLMIERVPEAMRGRILGTQNAIMTVAAPAGILLAAVLTEYITVIVAALVLAALWCAAAAWALCARALRNLEPEAGAVAGRPGSPQSESGQPDPAHAQEGNVDAQQ